MSRLPPLLDPAPVNHPAFDSPRRARAESLHRESHRRRPNARYPIRLLLRPSLASIRTDHSADDDAGHGAGHRSRRPILLGPASLSFHPKKPIDIRTPRTRARRFQKNVGTRDTPRRRAPHDMGCPGLPETTATALLYQSRKSLNTSAVAECTVTAISANLSPLISASTV